MKKFFSSFIDKIKNINFKKITAFFGSKGVTDFVIIVLIFVFCTSSYFLLSWVIDNERNNNIQKDLEKIVATDEDLGVSGPADEPVDFYDLKFSTKKVSELKKLNSDTVGWIQMRGTFVDYPVVQSKDNDFYLRRDFYKKNNRAGWIFADNRDHFNPTDNHTIIYGHMRADKKMFGSLADCLNKSWYDDYSNHYIWLNTLTENYIYQVFSIYTTSPEDNYIQKFFNSKDEYGNFLNTLKSKNQIPTLDSYGITNNDKIITLSTCYDGVKQRLVVHAKLVRIESADSPGSDLPIIVNSHEFNEELTDFNDTNVPFDPPKNFYPAVPEDSSNYDDSTSDGPSTSQNNPSTSNPNNPSTSTPQDNPSTSTPPNPSTSTPSNPSTSTPSNPSTSTPSDSSSTPPDSSSTPPDSSSTPPDSSSTPPDSSSTPPDSSSTPPDSSSTPPDSSSTPPDSSSSAPSE
ncbi:MAG: class B sortase [Clostridia bacterium]